MTAGEKLRQLRGHRSAREVAEEIGVTQQSVSLYENDLRVPRDAVKVKLAKLYGVTVESIFYTTE